MWPKSAANPVSTQPFLVLHTLFAQSDYPHKAFICLERIPRTAAGIVDQEIRRFSSASSAPVTAFILNLHLTVCGVTGEPNLDLSAQDSRSGDTS